MIKCLFRKQWFPAAFACELLKMKACFFLTPHLCVRLIQPTAQYFKSLVPDRFVQPAVHFLKQATEAPTQISD